MANSNSLFQDEVIKESQLEEAISQTSFNMGLIKKITASSLALFVALLVLYASAYGQPSYLYYRSLILSIILILTFMLFPMFKKMRPSLRNITGVIDTLLIIMVAVIQSYVILEFDQFARRQGSPTDLDVILGTIYVLLLLEATRRTVGWLLVILAGFFIGQLLISDKMPWIFFGPPMRLSEIIDFVWMRDEGIYSVPIMSVFTYVIPFLIFASFLIRSGAGKFFIELAISFTGRQVGGPAKAAIVSSGFMGSISGSAVANVVGTGTFTIPMMQRVGYKKEFAGAVEAVASTGGQIMPPVMGAAAFILAQNLQMPYGELILYALIPAFLYYLALYFSVHLEAKRLGLKTLAKESIPKTAPLLMERGYLLLPLIIILISLFMGFSAVRSALLAIIALVPLMMIRKSTRLSPVKFLSALEDAVRDLIPIAIACGAAGLIIAGVNISGVGLKFAYLITTISQGQLWLTLILVMISVLSF
ncbi:TRAP transporter permease [Mesobacillus campisalis]|uniref:TRAP transporter permease n=1 Tax=Mesobacillus campisalis TaxID=1408103 RepID=UPI00069AC24A|nr:TRAP transporter fused permease subunit [Mesobacillus campisalis]